MRRAVGLAAPAAAAALLLAGCGTTTAAPAHGRSGSTAPASTRPSSPGRPFRPTRARARAAGWRLAAPIAREAVVPTGSAAGSVVLAGGMRPDDTSTAAVWRVGPATGRATRMPSLAVPVHDAAGGLYHGHPAVFGGGNTSEQSLVQRLSGGRWHRVDAFPTTRSDLSAVTLPNAGVAGTVLLGGYDGSGTPRTIFRQRGRSSMRPVGRLAIGVRYAATAVVGGHIYVFGGEVAGHELSAVQRVDVRTGHTSVVAHLPRPVGHAMAAPFGDRILLMGGRIDPDTQTDRMWWFDPATDSFSRAGRLPRPLSDAGVAVQNHTVVLLGGEDPDVTDRVVRVSVR
ncbi:MAG: hypothetical protein ACRDPH_06320 [Marmoricola sp.]